MTYRITRRDGSFIANVNEKALVRGAAPLTLIGRGAHDFGTSLNENFIRLLENFAGGGAPTAPLRGMLWYDTTTAELKVQAADGSWKKLAYSANVLTTGGGTMTGDLKITNITNATYSLLGANGIITLYRPDNKTRINWGNPEITPWAALEQDANNLMLLGGGTIKIGDHAVWHSGNLSPTLYFPATGGTITGDVTVSADVTVRDTLTANIGKFETINVKTLNVTNISLPSGTIWTSENLDPNLYLLRTGGTITGSLAINGAATVGDSLTVGAGLSVNGGSVVTSENVQMRREDFSAFWHNDGAGKLHLLASNPGTHSSWNELRPFSANLTNGDVTFGHNVVIGNRLTVNSGRIGAVSNTDPTLFLYKPSGGLAGGWMINGNNVFSLTTLDGAGSGQSWSKHLVAVDSTGSMTVMGHLTAGGDVTGLSDERTKSNIRTLDDALRLVKGLRGVRYERDGRQSVGLIAQEVEKVVPEVVHIDPATDMRSVAYGNLVGLLVEAIRELSDKVDRLEGRA